MGREKGGKSEQIHPCYWGNNRMGTACWYTITFSYKGPWFLDPDRAQAIQIQCFADWIIDSKSSVPCNGLFISVSFHGCWTWPSDMANEVLADMIGAKSLNVLHNWTWCLCFWHWPWQEDASAAAGLKRSRSSLDPSYSLEASPENSQLETELPSWAQPTSVEPRSTCKLVSMRINLLVKALHYGVTCYTALLWQQLINTNGILIFLRSRRLSSFF